MHLSACRAYSLFSYVFFRNYRYRPRSRGETRLCCVASRESSFQFSGAAALLTLNQYAFYARAAVASRRTKSKGFGSGNFPSREKKFSVPDIRSPREIVALSIFSRGSGSATNTPGASCAILNVFTYRYADMRFPFCHVEICGSIPRYFLARFIINSFDSDILLSPGHYY